MKKSSVLILCALLLLGLGSRAVGQVEARPIEISQAEIDQTETDSALAGWDPVRAAQYHGRRWIGALAKQGLVTRISRFIAFSPRGLLGLLITLLQQKRLQPLRLALSKTESANRATIWG